MSPDAPPFGLAPQRTPVEFDPATGGLRIGPYERRVENPAEPGQVYGAYLSLLYAVRGAKPGERLPLRTADLEALLLIVGDDPETIEQRLVGLMGCSPEEASALGKLLLRHRKMTATLGIAATLSLGAAGVVTTVGDDSPAPAAPAAAQPVAVAPPAQPVPISGTTQAAPASPAQVGPPTTPVVVAAPAPAVEPPPAPLVVAVDPAPPPAAVAPAAETPAVTPAVPALVVEAPAVEVPAVQAPEVPEEPAPVAEPAYALPTFAVPVMDAPPPPVEVELPASDIGEPAVLDGEQPPLQEIGGVVDSGHSEAPTENSSPPADIGEPAVLDAPAVDVPVVDVPAVDVPAVDVPAVGEPISGVSGS